MKCDASPILALIIHVSDGAEKSPVDPIEELLSDESPSSSQPEVVQSVSTSSPTNDTGIISDSGLTIPVGTSQVRNDTQSADSDGDEEMNEKDKNESGSINSSQDSQNSHLGDLGVKENANLSNEKEEAEDGSGDEDSKLNELRNLGTTVSISCQYKVLSTQNIFGYMLIQNGKKQEGRNKKFSSEHIGQLLILHISLKDPENLSALLQLPVIDQLFNTFNDTKHLSHSDRLKFLNCLNGKLIGLIRFNGCFRTDDLTEHLRSKLPTLGVPKSFNYTYLVSDVFAFDFPPLSGHSGNLFIVQLNAGRNQTDFCLLHRNQREISSFIRRKKLGFAPLPVCSSISNNLCLTNIFCFSE